MSDIQRENGHVDIANKLIDSLMKTHLSGREWQMMMVIFRQTWGYCELKDGKKYKDKNGFWVKKKMDRISHSQFEKFTGINRRKIWNILNDLLNKNIIIKTITKKGDLTVCNYGIQKDSSKWILSPKKGIVKTITKKGDKVSPKRVIGVSPKKGARLSPKKGYTKETKETITKEIIQKVRNQVSASLKGKPKANNIEFDIDLLSWHGIDEDIIDDWEKRFPNIDVPVELMKIREHFKNNPKKAKDIEIKFEGRIPIYINDWLERAEKYRIADSL